MRSLGLLLLFLSAACASPIISGLLSGLSKGYGGGRYAASKRQGGILTSILGASSGYGESNPSNYQVAQNYGSQSYAPNLRNGISNQNAAAAQNYGSSAALANAQVITNSQSEQRSESKKEEVRETKEESSVTMSMGGGQINQEAASQLASAGGVSNAAEMAGNSQKTTTSQKRSGRKAKVKSTQSIRILMPGQNQAGKAAAAAGNYARTSKTIGQSMSKHKSEENSSTLMTQAGSRTDTASVTDKRHVGVDASQQAHFNTDSTGMQEIVLTQSSVAQKKKSRTETLTSSETGAATSGAALTV